MTPHVAAWRPGALTGRILALCVAVWLASMAAPLAAQTVETGDPVTQPLADAVTPDDVESGEDADATAEEPSEPATAPAPRPARVGTATPRDAVSALQGGPDYAAWRRTAERTEVISETGQGSDFALERLRADLVGWRDRFLATQTLNAARIATVRAQLDALGPPPEGDLPQDERVVARRTALQAELARLRAPAILAAEAYTHADGLIREVDSLIRVRQASQLMSRGQSPLSPGVWADAVTTMTNRISGLWLELRAGVGNDVRRGRFIAAIPRIGLLLIVGTVLLMRGRDWMTQLQGRVRAKTLRGRGVWTFVLSLGQIALPLLGLYALAAALTATGFLGFRSTQLVETLPSAGLFAILARWLAGHFFGADADIGPPFDFPPDQRRQARHLIVGLGWALTVLTLLNALIAAGEATDAVSAALSLPVLIVLAVLLFQLGLLFVRVPRTDAAPAADAESVADPIGYRAGILVLCGKIIMVIALAGPILSAMGFTAAAEALILPAVMTLALIGLVILLQGLAYDVYTLVTRAEDGNRDGLIPVLFGFVLALLAIPVLSLIWGGRVEDLIEIWTRFRDGYAIGETRISPTDFLMFLLVFGVGYMITRLLQGILRTTVLPKTRLDIGGRNAIVAGLGYVGIFVAALLAITSAGIDLSNLAIVAGALSVGIGFGLQNIVSNFVSGIILLIERPISEGDWIEVNGQMGYVRDISVRSTRIETFDRTDVIVPNADLVSGQVTNWTRGNLVGRVIIPVGVAYGTDTQKVSDLLREIAEAHPMVIIAPPPAIHFTGFGADSLDFEIRAILRDVNFSLTVKTEINHAIAKRFMEEGISIPFPQRDIWLRNPEALHAGGPLPADPEAVASAPRESTPSGQRRPQRPPQPDEFDADEAGSAATGDSADGADSAGLPE